VPSPRREVLLHLLTTNHERTTAGVARRLHLPTISGRRALEELAAHGLLEWRKDGEAENSPILWNASPLAFEHWRKISRWAENRITKPR
jgi:hypothetical protein